MDDVRTMVQTTISIDGSSSPLAQEQDLTDLRRRIEEAAATPGRFVDFIVVGNRYMSVLITPYSRVTISAATVQYDPRDTGDTDLPFGGFFDLL